MKAIDIDRKTHEEAVKFADKMVATLYRVFYEVPADVTDEDIAKRFRDKEFIAEMERRFEEEENEQC